MLQVATSLSRVNIANIFLEVYQQFYSKKKNSDFTKHPTNMTFNDARKSFEGGKRDAESLKVPTWKVVGTKWGESVGGLSFPVCRVLATIPERDTEHTVTLIQRTILSRLGFTPLTTNRETQDVAGKCLKSCRSFDLREHELIHRNKKNSKKSFVEDLMIIPRAFLELNYDVKTLKRSWQRKKSIVGLMKHHVIIVKTALQFCIMSKLNPAIGDFESSLTSSIWMGITRWAVVSNRALNSKPSWLVRLAHY
ncbi:hypothetical protein V1477_015020 [Vespula maculifrons]|uniref:Reverse transcriptase n=1 Tax=Vespula maculifrons TaxID=7453 RepID=A0ABD2BJL1_VESMC